MAKLVKQKYRSLVTGEVKINCYTIAIPKSEVKKAFGNDEEQLKVYAKGDKIIIEKMN